MTPSDGAKIRYRKLGYVESVSRRCSRRRIGKLPMRACIAECRPSPLTRAPDRKVCELHADLSSKLGPVHKAFRTTRSCDSTRSPNPPGIARCAELLLLRGCTSRALRPSRTSPRIKIPDFDFCESRIGDTAALPGSLL